MPTIPTSDEENDMQTTQYWLEDAGSQVRPICKLPSAPAPAVEEKATTEQQEDQ